MASAGVAKWTTAPVLKTGSQPGAWVRIPFPAPLLLVMASGNFRLFLGVNWCEGVLLVGISRCFCIDQEQN